MVEYALVAGFLAVAAGATLPRIGNDVVGIFARLGEYTAAAANRGGAPPTSPTRN
jgi:Flp pilus assembly pilin Flp